MPRIISVRRFWMKWPRGLIRLTTLANGFHHHMENHDGNDDAKRDREPLLKSGHAAFATFGTLRT
jgi:hypothetical protein